MATGNLDGFSACSSGKEESKRAERAAAGARGPERAGGGFGGGFKFRSQRLSIFESY